MKIKKGDQVIVTVGKDKGKKGKVEKVFPKESTVLVPGVNIVKKHEKKRDEQHPGGIIDVVKPITLGKIAVLCPKCGKQTRLGFRIVKDQPAGRQVMKERICRKCDQVI